MGCSGSKLDEASPGPKQNTPPPTCVPGSKPGLPQLQRVQSEAPSQAYSEASSGATANSLFASQPNAAAGTSNTGPSGPSLSRLAQDSSIAQSRLMQQINASGEEDAFKREVVLQRKLGQGSSGVVHMGQWKGQPAAIKHITTSITRDMDVQQLKAAREAHLGSKLDHPGLVRTLAHFTFASMQSTHFGGVNLAHLTVETYIVTEYCDRGTLAQMLLQPGHAPFRRASTDLSRHKLPRSKPQSWGPVQGASSMQPLSGTALAPSQDGAQLSTSSHQHATRAPPMRASNSGGRRSYTISQWRPTSTGPPTATTTAAAMTQPAAPVGAAGYSSLHGVSSDTTQAGIDVSATTLAPDTPAYGAAAIVSATPAGEGSRGEGNPPLTQQQQQLNSNRQQLASTMPIDLLRQHAHGLLVSHDALTGMSPARTAQHAQLRNEALKVITPADSTTGISDGTSLPDLHATGQSCSTQSAQGSCCTTCPQAEVMPTSTPGTDPQQLLLKQTSGITEMPTLSFDMLMDGRIGGPSLQDLQVVQVLPATAATADAPRASSVRVEQSCVPAGAADGAYALTTLSSSAHTAAQAGLELDTSPAMHNYSKSSSSISEPLLPVISSAAEASHLTPILVQHQRQVEGAPGAAGGSTGAIPGTENHPIMHVQDASGCTMSGSQAGLASGVSSSEAHATEAVPACTPRSRPGELQLQQAAGGASPALLQPSHGFHGHSGTDVPDLAALASSRQQFLELPDRAPRPFIGGAPKVSAYALGQPLSGLALRESSRRHRPQAATSVQTAPLQLLQQQIGPPQVPGVLGKVRSMPHGAAGPTKSAPQHPTMLRPLSAMAHPVQRVQQCSGPLPNPLSATLHSSGANVVSPSAAAVSQSPHPSNSQPQHRRFSYSGVITLDRPSRCGASTSAYHALDCTPTDNTQPRACSGGHASGGNASGGHASAGHASGGHARGTPVAGTAWVEPTAWVYSGTNEYAAWLAGPDAAVFTSIRASTAPAGAMRTPSVSPTAAAAGPSMGQSTHRKLLPGGWQVALQNSQALRQMLHRTAKAHRAAGRRRHSMQIEQRAQDSGGLHRLADTQLQPTHTHLQQPLVSPQRSSHMATWRRPGTAPSWSNSHEVSPSGVSSGAHSSAGHAAHAAIHSGGHHPSGVPVPQHHNLLGVTRAGSGSSAGHASPLGVFLMTGGSGLSGTPRMGLRSPANSVVYPSSAGSPTSARISQPALVSGQSVPAAGVDAGVADKASSVQPSSSPHAQQAGMSASAALVARLQMQAKVLVAVATSAGIGSHPSLRSANVMASSRERVSNSMRGPSPSAAANRPTSKTPTTPTAQAAWVDPNRSGTVNMLLSAIAAVSQERAAASMAADPNPVSGTSIIATPAQDGTLPESSQPTGNGTAGAAAPPMAHGVAAAHGLSRQAMAVLRAAGGSMAGRVLASASRPASLMGRITSAKRPDSSTAAAYALMPPSHMSVATEIGADALLEAIDTLIELADALRYMHNLGVVHGDLKTSNILLQSSDKSEKGFVVKIADFGVSRMMQDSMTHITIEGMRGTPAYIAPELVDMGKMSPACDVYAFGIMMWEMMTHQLPFEDMSFIEMMSAKTLGRLDDLLVFPTGLPWSYENLARACWGLRPETRPNMTEVMHELERVKVEVLGGSVHFSLDHGNSSRMDLMHLLDDGTMLDIIQSMDVMARSTVPSENPGSLLMAGSHLVVAEPISQAPTSTGNGAGMPAELVSSVAGTTLNECLTKCLTHGLGASSYSGLGNHSSSTSAAGMTPTFGHTSFHNGAAAHLDAAGEGPPALDALGKVASSVAQADGAAGAAAGI